MERETYFDGRSYTAINSKNECVQVLGGYENIGTASEFRALKEAEQKRREGCGYCALVYKISGEDYNIPPEADVRLDNHFCPMCGRDLRGDKNDDN